MTRFLQFVKILCITLMIIFILSIAFLACTVFFPHTFGWFNVWYTETYAHVSRDTMRF